MDNNNKSGIFVEKKDSGPTSKEAEQNCLGLCMKYKEVIPIVTGIILPEDMYWNQHVLIFQVIIDLYSNKLHIDPITVGDELEKRGQIHAVGGKAYLHNLSDVSIGKDDVADYANRVRQSASLRAIIEQSENTINEIRNGVSSDPVIIVEKQTRSLHNISKREVRGGFSSAKDLTKDILYRLDPNSDAPNDLLGIPTGFSDIDRSTTGLHRGEMTIVAGRTSMGKTAFALQLGLNVAINQKLPIAIFSLEMTKEQLLLRAVSSLAGVNSRDMKMRKLNNRQWDDVVHAVELIENSPIFIDDTSSMSVLEMKSKCNKLIAEHGEFGLIIVDYIGLVKSKTSRSERNNEVAEVSADLKALSKDLNTPLIALSQLNRNPEMRSDHRPVMGDLSESDKVSCDADQVYLLYRPGYYKKKTLMSENSKINGSSNRESLYESEPMNDNDDDRLAEIIIDKNRNGFTGIIRLNYDDNCTRFSDRVQNSYNY